MVKIRRALISVYDKTGILPLAQILAARGVELISTGGTAQFLRSNGVPVVELSEYTAFPEMLAGRVKTLHPKVHGGLLFRRGNPDDERMIQAHGIAPIDLVVVNLYPFEQTIAKPSVLLAEAIENIDIGGPSMLRSAAKNHESVTVVSDPMDYAEVADQIQATGGTSTELRQKLAAQVFARTGAYDRAIAGYLTQSYRSSGKPDSTAGQERTDTSAEPLPAVLTIEEAKVHSLRYGENPHQRAALYGSFRDHFQQLQGKELSYNNILDLTAAVRLIAEFPGDRPTVAILKHTNPCGVGRGSTLREAYENALATDRQAAFGGIVVANAPLDRRCAEAVVEVFSELVIAPEFTSEALGLLQTKKNLRLLSTSGRRSTDPSWEVRSVGYGSFLLQEVDPAGVSESDFKVVTKRSPSETEWQALRFGWRVVKHVKSNAIVYASADHTLGIGAGQMSRVDASRIAIWKAAEAQLSLQGSVVCSDAFFPFPDGLIAAAEAGASAAIQPGGSVKDAEVIAAAEAHRMAMVFTGKRHFRH